jgi:alcohol dehydrogenase
VRAVVFDGQLRIAEQHPEPDLMPGEAIIRPHLAGICNTDVEITRGYMNFQGVLGHEFVGTVVACADSAWIGRRVVGEINAYCRLCAIGQQRCPLGQPNHCPERTTLGIFRRNGTMAEVFSLPIGCLHPVPDQVADEAAVFTEPLAAALELIEQSHIRPTERVALIGDGKLGMLCAQVLRLTGCDLTVIGRHPERWDLLRRQGIALCRAGRGGEADEAAQLPSAGFDVVVDCTGHPSGLQTARRLVRPRGRLILKTTVAADGVLELSRLVVDEIQLIGSRCGPFDAALRLLQRGLVETSPLIAGRFPLTDALSAFRAAEHRLKVLLEVSA